MQAKQNLLGFSLESLENYFQEIKESKFRAKQVFKWVHQKGVTDFSLMTDLNKNLREKLLKIAVLQPPLIEDEFISDEGTKKYLIKLLSGSMVGLKIWP